MLVPTRMGMILNGKQYDLLDATCPHTHGDDPDEVAVINVSGNLSPHAWG